MRDESVLLSHQWQPDNVNISVLETAPNDWGEALGLTDDELAFYEVLKVNDSDQGVA